MTVTYMQKRRFIAGAVCPRCAKMDKIIMYDDQRGERWRECVACGFKDKIIEATGADEPVTRVNQARLGEKPLAHEDEIQIVKLMPENKK